MKRAVFCLGVGVAAGVLCVWAGVGVPYIFVASAAAFTVAMEATNRAS